MINFKHLKMTFLCKTLLRALIILICIWSNEKGYSQSRSELILGKWVMEGGEFGSNKLVMRFGKDSISTMERWEGEKSILKASFRYLLSDEDKYLLLVHLDSGSRNWYVGIIDLDETTLKLRSQSPDSSLLILTRTK